jgi:hypothetical protein
LQLARTRAKKLVFHFPECNLERIALSRLFDMKKSLLILTITLSVSGCAPRREFVRFEDAGTFRPGPGQDERRMGAPEGEYDSYELINHGAPNHGIAPMYQGYQQPVYHGGYPQVVETYDPYGNRQRVVIPNPW